MPPLYLTIGIVIALIWFFVCAFAQALLFTSTIFDDFMHKTCDIDNTDPPALLLIGVVMRAFNIFLWPLLIVGIIIIALAFVIGRFIDKIGNSFSIKKIDE